MKLTQFARRFTKKTGIGELMEDLGQAMQNRVDMYMLGGGNPAHIPEINKVWHQRIKELLVSSADLDDALVNYDTPQGKHIFLDSLAELFNREFGWNISTKNLAITNGSQTAFFILFNLFGGRDNNEKMRRILFPLSPEYIGYADQALEPETMLSRPASIEETRSNFFKYHVDFNSLDVGEDIAAICVSRPTNPTGNVLTGNEIDHLAQIVNKKNIPLILDCAYGEPFPGIIFKEPKPFWKKHIILGLSLSKLGLPAVRTGIVVASEEIIESLSACNAVLSLANGSFGQVLVQPLIKSREILSISRNIIRPFYKKRCTLAVEAIQEEFGSNFPYRIHEPEGAFFLWLWFPGLPISSEELYERLKQRGVLVVSGHYFFYGLDEPWPHAHECLRLSYALDPQYFRKAIVILAEELRKIFNDNVHAS